MKVRLWLALAAVACSPSAPRTRSSPSSSSSATSSPRTRPRARPPRSSRSWPRSAARQGQGRGVPELDAVQGRRGDGSAVARLGADARTVARQVRPAGRARVRGVRPAVHLRRLRRAAQGHRGPGRQGAVQEARFEGHHRPGLLGQRLQDPLVEQAAEAARRRQGPEDADPELAGALGADEGAGRAAADDGVLRGLPGAADRRRRRHREPAVEPVHAEDARGPEARDRQQPRLPGLRGHRQQEVLGRPARRRPRRTRGRDGRGDQVRQQDRQGRERRGAGEGEGVGQDRRSTSRPRRKRRRGRRRWSACTRKWKAASARTRSRPSTTRPGSSPTDSRRAGARGCPPRRRPSRWSSCSRPEEAGAWSTVSSTISRSGSSRS